MIDPDEIDGQMIPEGTSEVRWNNSSWYLKLKRRSVNEIVGYKLADSIGLPTQEWKGIRFNTGPGVEVQDVGLLVRKWNKCAKMSDLRYPKVKYPDKVAKALALAVLSPKEEPDWMMNQEEDELRLIDFEFTGPALTMPNEGGWEWLMEDYLIGVCSRLSINYEAASFSEQEFIGALQSLANLNMREVADFSGHTNANWWNMKTADWFKEAQRRISQFIQLVT